MTRLIVAILAAVLLCPIHVHADTLPPEGAGAAAAQDTPGESAQGEKSLLQDAGQGKPQSMPPRDYLETLAKTDELPRNFKVEYWEGKNNEIWLVPRDRPESRFFLSEYGYSAGVRFSENENWIALTDVVDVCCRYDVHLFKRGGDGRYSKIRNADISAGCLTAIRRVIPTLRGIKLDRLYPEAVAFSDDERALLVKINGELTDGGHILHPCYCVYDLIHQKVSFDLSLFNRNSHEISPLIQKENRIRHRKTVSK